MLSMFLVATVILYLFGKIDVHANVLTSTIEIFYINYILKYKAKSDSKSIVN